MAQINSTDQNDEIVNIINSNGLNIDSCWLGAYGYFNPVDNSMIWTWVIPFRDIPWDFTLETAMAFTLQSRADKTKPQGLVTRLQDNQWIWSHSDFDFVGDGGRKCVACLDLTPNTHNPSSVQSVP